MDNTIELWESEIAKENSYARLYDEINVLEASISLDIKLQESGILTEDMKESVKGGVEKFRTFIDKIRAWIEKTKVNIQNHLSRAILIQLADTYVDKINELKNAGKKPDMEYIKDNIDTILENYNKNLKKSAFFKNDVKHIHILKSIPKEAYDIVETIEKSSEDRKNSETESFIDPEKFIDIIAQDKYSMFLDLNKLLTGDVDVTVENTRKAITLECDVIEEYTKLLTKVDLASKKISAFKDKDTPITKTKFYQMKYCFGALSVILKELVTGNKALVSLLKMIMKSYK